MFVNKHNSVRVNLNGKTKSKQTMSINFLWRIFTISVVILLISIGLYGGFSSNAKTTAPSPMCTLPNDDAAGGVYYSRTPDILTTIAGVFTVDANTGNLYYCDVNSNDYPVAAPPAGDSGQYGGLGGWDTWYNYTASNQSTVPSDGGNLTLVETSSKGMLFCYDATIHQCNPFTFYPFPVSYCSQLPNKYCDPVGTVLDSNLNVYWVDPVNSILTECSPPYVYASSCTTLIKSSQFEEFGNPVYPVGLALVNSSSTGWQFYISDASCAGNVWRTSAGINWQLSRVATLNDSLSGIGSSTYETPSNALQIFVGDTGTCHGSSPKIVDISTPTPSFPFSMPIKLTGRTMYLSTCLGQCLGYPEGTPTVQANNSAARNLFFSLGYQDFAAGKVPKTGGTTSTGGSSSTTSTILTTYKTVTETDSTTTTLTNYTTVTSSVTDTYETNLTSSTTVTYSTNVTYSATSTYNTTFTNSTTITFYLNSTITVTNTVNVTSTVTTPTNSTSTTNSADTNDG